MAYARRYVVVAVCSPSKLHADAGARAVSEAVERIKGSRRGRPPVDTRIVAYIERTQEQARAALTDAMFQCQENLEKAWSEGS